MSHQITLTEMIEFLRNHEIVMASSTKENKKLVCRAGSYFLYDTGSNFDHFVLFSTNSLSEAVNAYNDCH